MLCKKIEGLLKADYLDGELDPQGEQQIREHLLTCAGCSRLAKELQLQREALKKAGGQQPPERVWHQIRERIFAEQMEAGSSLSAGLLGHFREYLSFRRKPAFILAGALAVAVSVLFFAGVSMQQRASLEKRNAAENSYLLYDLGTNVEEYFL